MLSTTTKMYPSSVIDQYNLQFTFLNNVRHLCVCVCVCVYEGEGILKKEVISKLFELTQYSITSLGIVNCFG